MTSRAGRALGAAVAGALAAALAAAGCSSGGPARPAGQTGSAQASGGPVAGPAAAPGQPLRWRPCPKVGRGLRCASLRVPLNYAKPDGRQLTLALSEIPATAPPGRRLGALLVNPGGPGGSGLGLASYVAGRLRPAVAARYDIVGFDTRGTGSSVPALHCDRSFFAGVRPDYIPASKAAERVLTGRARAYAADCGNRFGWLLPYMTTPNIARDLNSIRIALRQPRISYFAYSYGTYIGQVFATM
ncbi:MAG TPA: alpha/beta fold hydrolase, partial [Streptosporangiaceae bacterium]